MDANLQCTVYWLLETYFAVRFYIVFLLKYNFFIIRNYFGEGKILLFSRTRWNTEPVWSLTHAILKLQPMKM
jgi:hypothetical protein